MERLPTPPNKQAQARTHAVPPGAYSATATVDDRGMVTGWSDGARRLLGYQPPEVLGHQAVRLLADVPGEAAGRVYREAAAYGRWGGTVALRHRDGHRIERQVLAHRRTPHGAGGTEWLIVSAVTGPSHPDRDRALGEWAFDRSPCVMAVFDQDLRLVRASAGMEHALSVTAETMRGLRLPDIVPHPASHEAERRMRSVLEDGEPQDAPVCLDPIDPQRPWQARLIPLNDSTGQIRAVHLVAHSHPSEDLIRRRMRLLSDAGRDIGTSSDTHRTAQELADVAVPRLADTCTIDLLDAPRHGEPPPSWSAIGLPLSRAAVRSVTDQHPSPRPAGRARRCPAWSPPAQCLVKGRGAVLSVDEDAITRWAQEDPEAAWIRDSRTHSLMVVPIRAAGTSFGVALFGRHDHPDPFDSDDLWLAEQLAAKAAMSIHSARRPKRQHTTTMALQRSLLPQILPEQGAMDIATRYLPSVSQAGVGGDWFDVIPLSGTRVALVVGDVVGHGIRASATMGRVRTAVRTLADVDLPPDELLSHLDDLVIHLSAEEAGADNATETAGGVGTTCLYAVYDPVSRHCALARAGHPPPAVVTPGGAVRFLDVPPGPPLGLGGLPFEVFETELPEGSLIALYTNGLLETRDHDIDDALDNMFAALAHPAESLDALCDRVLTSMLTHRPDDDIALLIARTKALDTDRVATWELPFDPATVADARRQATEQLTAWHLDEAVFVTELVVSELVTNAIRYGRPPIRLRLIHDHHTLTCEVFDSSNTAPHMRRARTFDEGGRGLLLVGQLTQRWGTRHTSVGKTVWAEQFLTEG
ncbi:SpoIIE family protein phosphatase [Streptomyces sp. NPDC086549]|uniref:SpoIIE family protein phosphatase n=1 Tax=Streptomyces sp. NPDC086549 TaxID=3365752 RepID=UPI00380FB4D0